MKQKFYLFAALTTLFLGGAFFHARLVRAQGCTDSAGGAIPCPTEEAGDAGSGGQTGPTFRFLGANQNFLDPANWNTGGSLPSTGATALVDNLTAYIDPADPTCGGTCVFGNLALRNGARLVVMNAQLEFDTFDSDSSGVEVYNSYIKAKQFIDPGGFGSGGLYLNPSFIEAERVVLFKPETPIYFGLGGNRPADAKGLGIGHYARIAGRAVDLDGRLELFTLYGFHPEPGQTFEIVTVTGSNPINGTFANAPEGAIITGFCDVQLRISYTGGDGNDLILTAEEQTELDPKCTTFDAPDAEKNVFINGEKISINPSSPVSIHDITLINGAEWELHDGTVTARNVDSTDSSISLFNSYLKADSFIDPGFGGGGIYLNPSFLEAIVIKLIHPNTRADFALGGPQPAGPDSLGKGFYARMQADTVELDGKLEIFLVYEFAPQAGQTFEIVTVNRPDGLKGHFANAPEGAIVSGYCDVALTISYEGGDGNDVILKAEKTNAPDSTWACDTNATQVVPTGIAAQSASTDLPEQGIPTNIIIEEQARTQPIDKTKIVILTGILILLGSIILVWIRKKF